MARSFYTPLDYSEDEIRLLVADFRNDCFQLKSNVSLRRSRLQFVALSYTWGDGTTQKSLAVNGARFAVSYNLYVAIDQVLTIWRETHGINGKPLFLWCDQICINQKNNEEKNHQVAFMRTIYERAEEVLVWLDLPTEYPTGLSAGIYSGANPMTWTEWKTKRESALDKVISWSASSRQMIPNDRLIGERRYSSVPFYVNDEARWDPIYDHIRAWISVCYIFLSPWWERAWVFQELIVATRARFLINGATVPWQELFEFLNLTSKKLTHQVAIARELLAHVERKIADLDAERDEYNLKLKASENRATKGAFSFSFRRFKNVPPPPPWSSRLRVFSKHIIPFHSDHLLQAQTKWNMIESIFHSKTHMASGNEYLKLSDLVVHAQRTLCVDPRDKVFAFAGLANPSYGVQVDYSEDSTLFRTLTAAATAIIATEQSLNILLLATEDRSSSSHDSWGLPTWVPDISTPISATSEHKRWLDMIDFPLSNCKATKDSKPEVSFATHPRVKKISVLTAKGIRIDNLRRIIRDDPLEPYRRFQGSSVYEIVTRNTARQGDEVWALLGLDIILVLGRPSVKDPYYTVIGPALVYEGAHISGVMTGSLMDQLDRGEATAEDISII